MEKKFDRNTHVLSEDQTLGTVQIADEVVAIVAGLAAMEAKGVAAMAGNITKDLLTKVGVKHLAKGVKVEVLGKAVKVDLTVVIRYGFNIPATCSKVQDRVKTAIENMTGLQVTDVNIRIAGVETSN